MTTNIKEPGFLVRSFIQDKHRGSLREHIDDYDEINIDKAIKEAEILEIIRARLKINVVTSSEYNGGMESGSMYSDNKRIQLLLDDVVISESYL